MLSHWTDNPKGALFELVLFAIVEQRVRSGVGHGFRPGFAQRCSNVMRGCMKLIFPLLILAALTGCSNYKSDKESGYSQLDDSRNETLAVKNILASHPDLADAHINATGFQGSILITGQVNSQELATIAAKTVERMRNVRRVYNELVVSGTTSMISRTNDVWLTSKVNASLQSTEELDSSRIKVTTDNGVVYLMGAISRREADLAVESIQNVAGVQKIVKVFNYLN